MRRDDVLTILRARLPELQRQFAVQTLALFGSTTRGDATATSDVDILVSFAAPPGFDGYMALKHRLEELLGCPVDLVMEKALTPAARPIVEREAIHVA
jgi:hypothetical protein